METKHTPTPWHIGVQYKGMIDIRAGQNGFVIAEVTSDCITHFVGNTDEALANAKLIAAAPELLEALQFAVKFIKCCPELSKEERRPRGLEKWEAIIKKATE